MLRRIVGSLGAALLLLPSLSFSQGSLTINPTHTWGGTNADVGNAAATDSAGNVYVTGVTSSFGAGGQDVLLLKYDPSGALLWERTWGGPSNESGNGVLVGSDGNVYVVGETESYGAGWYDVLILKFDSSGTLQWARTWGGGSFDVGYDLSFDQNGNIAIAAESYSFGNSILLLTLSTTGNFVSATTWKGPATYDSGYSITVDSDGDEIITGTSWDYSVNPNHNRIPVLKFDHTGTLLWSRMWAGPSEDEASGRKVVRTDSQGNIYILGHTSPSCMTSNFSQCVFQMLLLKISSSGDLLWAQKWGGSGYEGAGGLWIDSNNQLEVAGSITPTLGGIQSAMIQQYDTNGNVIASKMLVTSAPSGLNSLTVSGTGTYVATGFGPNNGGTWQNTGIASTMAPGSLTTPPGLVTNVTGSFGSPSGTILNPTGILDVGGGLSDVLTASFSFGQGSCFVNVTKLYQAVDATGVVQPWACDVYNHPYGTVSSEYCSPTPPKFRIAQEGCALTALTMSLNTAGGLSFDPGSLNQFMLQPQNAFTFGADHGVDFDLTVDDVSGFTGRNLAWNFFSSQSVQDLKNTLCASGTPVVVGVDLSPNGNNQPVAGHFVLVTGWDGTEFQIADPGYPSRTSLQDYSNQFIGAGYVTDPPTGASSLHISVADAELLVTDPSGLKSGFDVTSVQNLNQIPTSAYSRMNLINDETGEPAPQTGYYLDIHGAANGTYTVFVQGLKLEQFNLSIASFDLNGTPEPPLSIAGIAAPGSSQAFVIQYVGSAGANSSVAAVANFQNTLGDIQNSLTLGLIDNAGIANSLAQKIQAAQSAAVPAMSNVINAFINEVNAQAGKHINGSAAQILLQDAASLLTGA